MSVGSGGRLADKRALVTGAGKGNGRAIAELFAAQGAAVACVDLDEGAANEAAAGIVASGGQAVGLAGDVARAESVERFVARAVETLGGLEILVNNVGLGGPGTIETTDEAEWDRVLAVNAKSVYLVSRAALPHLRAAGRDGGAAVVNIGSGVGVRGAPNWVAYGSSKAAVVMLTKNMALDHARDGIRVNCVCPGQIETELGLGNLRLRAEALGISLEEMLRRSAASYPLGRIGQPRDVAYAALYLASDEASWVTGEVLIVDGGRCAGAG
jgi:NAD(P)-dependent dehydrogenase (short-subunit alcohol dehydrogenase family)